MDYSGKKCKIVVDAMGSDFAPLNDVLGAIQASKEDPSIEILLTGKKDEIIKVLKENNIDFNQDNIINCEEVVYMSDSPMDAFKNKKNSSLYIGTQMVHEGLAQAFVSAGNTGAVMSTAYNLLGMIEGVERPTIGALFPSLQGKTMIFDVGSSVDARPRHLLDFAVMGTTFMEEIYDIKNPSVGVLSLGEEESKGNLLSKRTFEILKQTDLNFYGNVEGRDVLKGTVNVVVCDGFVGNVILKFGESVLTFLKEKFKQAASESFTKKLKIGIAKGSLKEILKDFDYQEHGGVPLLGTNGIVIIGHGSSTSKAIKNMVLRAKEMNDKSLVQKISQSVSKYSSLKK